MIRVGLAGIPVRAKGMGTLDGLKCLGSLGLDAMEVQFVRNVYMDKGTAEEAGKLARSLGLMLSVHCPYYINLTSKKPETQEKSKQWILESARMAKHMGASIVVFHPARDKVPETVTGHLAGLSSILKSEGNDVRLGLETTGDRKEFGDINEIMDIIKLVPGTDIVLDFAHIHSRSDGGLKSPEDYEAVFKTLKPVKENDFHIHFSGIEYKDGREVRHLPIEDGPDFRPLAAILKEKKYDATIICESPRMEEDALLMKRLLGK